MIRPHFCLVFVGVLTACASAPTSYARQIESVGIDLRPYSGSGFLFTPDPLYAGKYEALGIITVHFAAAGKIGPQKQGFPAWEWEPVSMDDVLKAAQKRVVEMGGNALVNFKITTVEATVVGRPTFDVSGFAIRRLDVGQR